MKQPEDKLSRARDIGKRLIRDEGLPEAIKFVVGVEREAPMIKELDWWNALKSVFPQTELDLDKIMDLCERVQEGI